MIYTDQTFFNKAAKHLLKQNKKAIIKITDASKQYEETSECQYRTKSGLKCAIGCFIPKSKYSPKIEGDDVIDVFYDVGMSKDVGNVNTNLMYELQDIHDHLEVKEWRKGLIDCAKIFKLELPECLL